MRDYIPKAGDHVVAVDRGTGRALETGMPCKIDFVPKDARIIQCTDYNGHGRIFDCGIYELVRVFWAIERIAEDETVQTPALCATAREGK